MQTNYSIDTSLPAYQIIDRDVQCNKVLKEIELLKDSACIRSIALNLNMADSTVSGRVNDLIKLGKVEYYDKRKLYNMMRKVIRVRQNLIVNEKNNQIKMFL